MRTFLGVPVLVRGRAWGNLYLTEKAGGADFDEADELSVGVLADWAAIAIEHARLYASVRERGDSLERALRGFEATATIAQAVGAETDLDRVLELVVKRARALVDARSVLILLCEATARASPWPPRPVRRRSYQPPARPCRARGRRSARRSATACRGDSPTQPPSSASRRRCWASPTPALR